MKKTLWILFALTVVTSSVFAQNLADFEKKVTEFTLDNGMHFIVIEKHEAPVVSFYTYANVGSVDEDTGITGMAHLFEHMAFKGTTTVGTKDITKEMAAMDKEDDAFLKLRAERDKGNGADPALLKKYEQDLDAAVEDAKQYVVSNELGDAIDRAGGVGLNAETQSDATVYYYSLPSNKLELWFSLESGRFLDPVLREFYTEKNVVMEERRLSVENRPIGSLLEDFLGAAYEAHPYGQSGIGWMTDLQHISRPEALAFFKKHYVPANLTFGIVGDVDPKQARQLAETYFGRIPSSPPAAPVHTVEPEQRGERRVVRKDKSQPVIIFGYHKGNILDPDEEVWGVMSDILGRGRASRLYTDLVKKKQIAISTSGFSGFPGDKYPNMMLFYAFPATGHSNDECQAALFDEVEKIKKEPVTEDELKKAKTRARADLIHELDSNAGLAQLVATYQGLTGDWRNLFKDLDKLNAVTAQDIQRVANKYLTDNNRTVATIETIQ